MATEIQNGLKNAQMLVTPEREKVGQVADQLTSRRNDPANRQVSNDTVTLTDTAIRLRTLSRQLAEEPFVDARHVENIRQQLSAGTYKINAERIAERLLAYDRGLGSEGSQ